MLSVSYSADECRMMAAALDFFAFDVIELETIHLAGRNLSILSSANAKMSNMSFEDDVNDTFPLTPNELSMAASAMFYVADSVASGDIELEELPEDIRDTQKLVCLAKAIESQLQDVAPSN